LQVGLSIMNRNSINNIFQQKLNASCSAKKSDEDTEYQTSNTLVFFFKVLMP
jgi:hypothetical protein